MVAPELLSSSNIPLEESKIYLGEKMADLSRAAAMN
jgi:hypothetical protein